MTTIHSSGINPLANSNPQTQIPAAPAASPTVTLPGDGFSMGGTQQADQILNSLGLSPIDTTSLMSQLSPTQQQALSQLGGQAFSMSSSELQGAFANFVSGTPVIDYQDVNALVQQVLREAYTQNTEDLRMYAEKVKFYNKVKEALRDELNKARKALTAAGPGEADTDLSAPFSPTNTSSTYTGNQDIQQWSGARANDIRSGDAKFKTGEFAGDWQVTSGNRWDPLAIDLNGDGQISTIDAANGVFNLGSTTETQDVNGSWSSIQGGNIAADANITQSSAGILFQGTQERQVDTMFTEWFAPTEGIVVFDRNGDGNIQGSDLFGDKNVTGRDVADGYEDLSLLDTNNDGVVDFNDEEFKNLQIWQDANSDGIAQEGELTSLFQNGIASLSTKSTGGAVAGENADIIAAANNQGATQLEGALFNKGQLDDYIKQVEDQLNSVGDDAQLANVDLQNMLQKQQQTLQTMSNISKSLHDTAMSVIRKMGG